jgi:hypothetical protein
MGSAQWPYQPVILENAEKEIYANEIQPFLPQKIIDFHTHICLKEYVQEPHTKNQGAQESNYYSDYTGRLYPLTIEKLLETNKTIYAGKEVMVLCLPIPFCLFDAKSMNLYIKDSIEKHNVFGLAAPIYNKTQDLDDLIEWGGFKGFKTFCDLPNKMYGDNSINLSDLAKSEMMKVANKRNLIVVIHLPKSKRIADPENIKEIKEIATKYPDANIVLAHMGRSFCPEVLQVGLKSLGKLDNVYLDTSGVTEEEVFRFGLEEWGIDKVTFGTDSPLSFLRAKRPCLRDRLHVQKSGMSLWYVKENVPWVTSEERKGFEKEIDQIILYAYNQILGIKRAAMKIGLGRKDVEKIFCKNAERLLAKTGL